MKIVLTGPASCGKTTLLNALAEQGYQVVPEAARQIFTDNKLTSHSPISTFSNQFKIYQRQLELEEQTDPSQLYFLDRCLVDNIAYSDLLLGEVPSYVDFTQVPGRYDKIYMLERLPLKGDDIRVEKTGGDLVRAEEKISDWYFDLGFNVTKLPRFSYNPQESLEKRLRVILDSV